MWRFLVELTHPLSGSGYQFWSGIGSDFGEASIVGALALIYRKHECHKDGCHRPSWHVDPLHGHPVCRRHHSQPDHPALRKTSLARRG